MFSCPGKIFLIGEYTVLGGEPAAALAVGARFRLDAPQGTGVGLFHPESPAGKFLQSYSIPEEELLTFRDPWNGSGGLGGSTAQLALLMAQFEQKWRPEGPAGIFEADPKLSAVDAWKVFRRLAPMTGVPPSGADLVAQWSGGLTIFDPSLKRVERWIEGGVRVPELRVVLASEQQGRKVASHAHLKQIEDAFSGRRPPWLGELCRASATGLAALREGRWKDLGDAMEGFGDVLRDAGFELEATSADRTAFRSIPGVLGVKGAGAMQADALVLVVDPRRFDSAEFAAVANARGLRVLGGARDGLLLEAGIQLHHEERE